MLESPLAYDSATTAAASTDMPGSMPPPPLPQELDGAAGSVDRAFFGRSTARATIELEGKGKISFYELTGNFEARCSRHVQCALTRTCRKTTRSNGRPLGLLTAWLNMTCSAELHRDKSYIKGVLHNHSLRLAAREYFQALPGATALLELERAREADEGPEPKRSKGLFSEAFALMNPLWMYLKEQLYCHACGGHLLLENSSKHQHKLNH
eukprot:6485603-Amphidinium_carterae.1